MEWREAKKHQQNSIPNESATDVDFESKLHIKQILPKAASGVGIIILAYLADSEKVHCYDEWEIPGPFHLNSHN